MSGMILSISARNEVDESEPVSGSDRGKKTSRPTVGQHVFLSTSGPDSGRANKTMFQCLKSYFSKARMTKKHLTTEG